LINIECYLHINIKFHLCSQNVLTVRRLKRTLRTLPKQTGGKRQRDEERKNSKYYQRRPGGRRYKYNREPHDVEESFYHDVRYHRRSLRLHMKKLEKNDVGKK
jgi:hypothetical protein